MENKFDSILKQSYRAAIFDFDGTLTAPHFGSVPPESLRKLLQEMCVKIPLAICSARILPGLLDKMKVLLDGRLELGKYWTLFVENGAAGYRFNAQKNEFEEFYRAVWPEEKLPRKNFDEKVKNYFSKLVDYISINPSSYIFRPLNYERLSTPELIKTTDALEVAARKFLLKNNADNVLEIGNSKLGIIIYLKEVDKDRAIEEFGKILGLQQPYREIVAVGDQPGPGGNDRAFLAGKFGTPFTVGTLVPENHVLMPVFDELGNQITGPAGTEYLLRRLRFEK